MKRFQLIAVMIVAATEIASGQAWDGDFPGDTGAKQRPVHPIVETQLKYGGKAWGFLSSGGTEIRYKRFTSLFLASANKIDNTTGPSFQTDANSYFNFTRYLFAGGGIITGKLGRNPFAPSALHPYIGGGYGDDDFSLKMDYLFPGTDSTNRLSGNRIEVTVPLQDRKLYWITSWSFYRIGCQVCQRTLDGGLTTGLRYRF